MIKMGVIGIGVIAKYYLAAFSELKTAKLRAVCDLNSNKIQTYIKNGIAAYVDYQKLLSNPNIEAVIINLPNNLHFKACGDALNAGKHVCCEKPLTLTLEEANTLGKLATQKKLTLFTAFHRRYNRPLIDLKKSVDSLSHIKHMDITYKEKIEEHAGNDTWYLNTKICGGGCVADNGPNVYDTITWILGRMEITHVCIQRDDNGLDLQAQVQLVNQQKQTATAYLDWSYPGGEDKVVTLHLTDGTIVSADMLDGFMKFKSSLFHEYAAIVEDFVTHINEGRGRGEEGTDAVRLVTDTYAKEPQSTPTETLEIC